MRIQLSHNLGQEEAMNRIKGLFNEMKQEHGDRIQNLQEKWESDAGTFSFQVNGFSISIEITVTPSTVVLSGNIPVFALPFKSKIEQEIRKRATELLS